jgi:squalene-hopene/tetraprenyl-beta-curcumene cyclase
MENGCFTQGKLFSTYRTSLTIMALHQLDAAKYKGSIDKAVAWLKHDQFSEDSSEKVGPDNPHYGGFGYDDKKGEKPDADLSNTHMALAALHEAGVAPDDPVFKRALEFVTRSQNNPETNKGIKGVVKPMNDGGFFYGPSRSQSAEGPTKNEDGSKSYESYASMTYAGLVSFIYAGVGKDDARVKAALGWIKEHYTLEENYGLGIRNPKPNAAQMGLFYFYLVFAKALDAYGEKEIDTAKGKRSWARDLLDVLAAKQKPDGSWINENSERWMEGNPLLATLYAVNAIELSIKHRLDK